MKNLDEVINDLENLTTCDETGYSYIANDDMAMAVFFLKNYKRIIDVLGSLLNIHKNLSETNVRG